MQLQNIFVTGMMTAFMAALIVLAAAPAMVSAQEETVTIEDIKSLPGFQNYSVLGSFKKALVQDPVLYRIMHSNKELSEETMRSARLQRKILQDIETTGDTGLAMNPYVVQFAAKADEEENKNGDVEGEQRPVSYPTSNSVQGSSGGTGGISLGGAASPGVTGGGGGTRLGGFNASLASADDSCVANAGESCQQSETLTATAIRATERDAGIIARVALRRDCLRSNGILTNSEVTGCSQQGSQWQCDAEATCLTPGVIKCDGSCGEGEPPNEASCTLDGVTVQDNTSHEFYSETTPACGTSCDDVKLSRKCVDGTFDGDTSFDTATCTLPTGCDAAECIDTGNPIEDELANAAAGNDCAPAKYTQVSAGGSHTCALRSDGSAWCWGYNLFGQLGNNTKDKQNEPVLVSGMEGDVKSISAGSNHTCVVKSDGTAWCWGDGRRGRLGYGGEDNQQVPVQVVELGSDVKSISAGGSHTCAVKTDGSAWCWGTNHSGQLGDDTTEHRFKPARVSGLFAGVSTISAGNIHTCAVKTDGSAWCWGSGAEGRLGNGSSQTSEHTPVAVDGLGAGVADISAASSHTCALKTDNTVYCWGRHTFGELGIGEIVSGPSQKTKPVKVTGISGVQSITTNTYTTCAVKGDMSPWCWGAGWSLYLGEDSKDHKLEPTPVPALTAIKDISAGSKHNCALKESGCIWCWGDGELGELGHGEFVDSKVPVQVANPQGGGTSGAGEDEASCTLDGVTLADGDSEDFFKEQNPACGTSCDDVKLSRTCIAGSLIGNVNYEFATCTEPTGCSSGASCTTIDGETRPNGWTGKLFGAPSVSCLRSCENTQMPASSSSSWLECVDGKFQRCYNSFYDGKKCNDFTTSYGGNQTVEVCPSPVPPGGCPVSGTPPTVVENNAFASCTVNPCRSCTTHDGDVRPHDWQGSLYAKSVVPCGTCPSPRPCSCSDGTFKGECSWSGQNPKDNFFTSCRSERASCQWQAVGSEQISSALLHLGAGPGLCTNDNQPPAGTCSRNNTTASSSANQCGVMVNEVIQDDGTRLFPFTCNEGGGCYKEMNIYECK